MENGKTAVLILMGSNSDKDKMLPATQVLDDLGISFKIHIRSAHRTPNELDQLLTETNPMLIICGAGMAAHLAGAVAAKTVRPVIGVPLSGSLDGQDALYSTVQMPPGIPVATVAINGAKNAAWLAAQVIALGDEELTGRLKESRKKAAKGVLADDKKLQEEMADEGQKG